MVRYWLRLGLLKGDPRKTGGPGRPKVVLNASEVARAELVYRLRNSGRVPLSEIRPWLRSLRLRAGSPSVVPMDSSTGPVLLLLGDAKDTQKYERTFADRAAKYIHFDFYGRLDAIAAALDDRG